MSTVQGGSPVIGELETLDDGAFSCKQILFEGGDGCVLW